MPDIDILPVAGAKQLEGCDDALVIESVAELLIITTVDLVQALASFATMV